MKKLFVILLFALSPFAIFAQSPELQVFTNSDRVEGIVEMANYHRLTFHVENYTLQEGEEFVFGPIKAYKLENGQRTFIKDLREEESDSKYPSFTIGVGPDQNPDIQGHIVIEIEYVKKKTANGIEDIAFSNEQRSVEILMHE